MKTKKLNLKHAEINWWSIGNVREHEIQPYICKSDGVFPLKCQDSNLVLKNYLLMEKSYAQETFLNDDGKIVVGKFVSENFKNGKILPYSGMGFMIYSERFSNKFLNIARWDNERPAILKNNLYVLFEYKNSEKGFEELDIKTNGAFSAEELEIVEYEKNAWMRYLNSKKTINDKQNYLENVLQGEFT